MVTDSGDKISKGIENFLAYLREMEQLHNISLMNESEANDATQDILHSLELEEHDYHETARLGKKLKEVRQSRRAAKDLIQQIYPIVEWAENNRSVIKGLEQLLGKVRKEEKNTEGRFYTPRTDLNSEPHKKGRKVIAK